MWGWGRGEGIRATSCVPEGLGFGVSLDQEASGPHLIGVIGKVDFVEYLGGFVLDGLHLHQVWGVLPGPISKNRGGRGDKVREQRVHEVGSRGNF